MIEDNSATPEPEAEPKRKQRREIPGNLPYTSSPGAFKTVLENIIRTERPDKVTQDFVHDVLQVKGGSGKAAIPILKRTSFLSGEGAPTEIYARFKTESGRSAAAYDALRAGYQELFRRREYAHLLSEKDLQDAVVEITGLVEGDPIVKSICSTFEAIKSFIDPKFQTSASGKEEKLDENIGDDIAVDGSQTTKTPLGISYQINVVLPATTNIDVFNAIFKSLRDNLLK